MTSVSSRPVARLSTPGDVVATVPLLCGFEPADSVVVLSLRGPSRRLGLTVRLDLPPPASAGDAARLLARRVADDGGTCAVVVLYGAQRDEGLVDALVRACDVAGVRVVEALHVDAGSWTSYLCVGPCCPPEGTPVGAAPSLVSAEHALEGRAVLPDRAALVRSLSPPAVDRFRPAARLPREVALQRVRALLARVAEGEPLDAAAAAQVAAALDDVPVRDALLADTGDGVLQALCEQVVRLVPPPHDAGACTVLALVAYARGDGARASIALDRALRSDPRHRLALLLQAALDRALPPRLVREVLRPCGG